MLVGGWLVTAVVLRAAYAGKVMPGTHMAGIALSGASPEESQRRLRAAPGTIVTLTYGTTRVRVDGARAGLDLAGSAERAMRAGREGPLGGVWSSVVSVVVPRQVSPAYPSRRTVAQVVAEVARRVDQPGFQGALSIDADTGRVTPTLPRPGRAVERRATTTALLVALRRGVGGEVAMVVRRRPGAAPSAVRAIAGEAERLLERGLRLRGPGSAVDLSARRLAPVLELERVGSRRRPKVRLGVRAEPLARLVDAIAREWNRAAVDARITAPARAGLLSDKFDASWRPRSAHVRVRGGRSGRAMRRTATAAALEAAIRDGRREARIRYSSMPPRIPTTAAREVNALIGAFTTYFACCEPRVRNIRLIAEAVDGTVIAPGERFSLNGVAGPRTRAKGYVPAPFISDGELKDSVGGGVSQMSTTVYNAAYFAGLHIDAHTPHSFYISRYPPGREATLDYPGIDLVWTNDTRAPVLVRAVTTATSVSVTLYGDNGGRRVRARSGPRTPVAGGDFALSVTRKIRHPGGRTTAESYTTTYDRPPPP